jgi:hypothetical protein
VDSGAGVSLVQAALLPCREALGQADAWDDAGISGITSFSILYNQAGLNGWYGSLLPLIRNS